MSNRIIWLSVSLLLLIIVGMFSYTYFYQNNSKPTELIDQKATSTPNTYGITRIDAKHFYINGTHTIVGELAMPTPCDLLVTESRVAESFSEQVTFAFDVVNTTEICSQVITNQRFKIDAVASDKANLAATFMGTPVELNLVEAEIGETPESFELYIKG